MSSKMKVLESTNAKYKFLRNHQHFHNFMSTHSNKSITPSPVPLKVLSFHIASGPCVMD